jgi:hypothetical protein
VVGQPSSDWSVQRIGDVNGDHRDDIPWRDTGTTVGYRMEGVTVLNTLVIASPAPTGT